MWGISVRINYCTIQEWRKKVGQKTGPYGEDEVAYKTPGGETLGQFGGNKL